LACDIDAAGTATGIDGETVRRLGCTNAARESLGLLMPDDSSGN